MPSPQLEHGHTRIANELLEQLARELTSSGTQLAIMLLVMRYSYGFKRKFADLTMVEIARLLNLKRFSARRSVQALQEKNMLKVEVREGHQRRRFRVQKDYARWGEAHYVPGHDLSQAQLVAKGDTLCAPSKKVTKRTRARAAPARAKTSKFVPVWPDWVDPQEAIDFEKMRREKNVPLKPHAFNLMINKLDKWRAKGVDPNIVLAHSSSNGYTGVFPEKFEKGGPRQSRLDESWDKLQQAAEGE